MSVISDFEARISTSRAKRLSMSFSLTDVSLRLLDLAATSLALLLLSPLFAVVGIAIKWTSAGPVFFVQERVGQNGKTFRIYKFRSMRTDAETLRAAAMADSDRDGVCFKSRTDPRITGVGAILRRYSLDELPQLLNILKGDMSLVGPRPALPCEVALYSSKAMKRLRVKPGLTGIWQVSGRADIDFDRMIEMDLRYVRIRSVGTNLRLILRTFGAVLTGRGAY